MFVYLQDQYIISFFIPSYIISSFIMKNIYKLLKGIIVMMIAVTGLVASAGTPLPSTKNVPRAVFNPQTNHTLNSGGTQLTRINWNNPGNHSRNALPFFEPWDQASFVYQMWSFIPSQGNWAISTTQGNPLPTALFTGMPTLTNYDNTLQSYAQPGEDWTCANVYLEFDTRLIVNNPTLQEKLIIEINYNSSWYPKDTLINDLSTGWVHHKIDITEAGGTIFRVGFRATGINSADLGEWDVDNIYVYTICYPPPDFNLDRTGNIVHLSWGTPCTGKILKPNQVDSSTLLGYNIYRTDESGLPPFVKLNMAMLADTEYTDVLATTFDGVACYYVSAIYEDSLNPAPPYLCESPSDTLCVHYTAGIPEQNEAQVRIFPNPVSEVLNIETDLPFTGIEVINFLGEKIYSGSFPETNNFVIPMKDNPSGNYLLKINFRNGMIVEKVLKK
jgi:hypothetical protein